MSSAAIRSFRTIFGTWRTTATSSAEVDLEAQTITGSRTTIPTTVEIPSPSPVYTSTSHIQPEEGTDPIDDFFGVTRSPRTTTRGTQDSRHDTPTLHVLPLEEEDSELPPPYADASDLPSYTAVAQPPTLAMYLFKFGFFFPLFWLAGIIILISPLQAPENWEPTKTEAERHELIELLRRTERKWAKRCLFAFCLLTIIALVITLTAVMVMRS